MERRLLMFIALLLTGVPVFVGTTTTARAAADWWRPDVNTSWQIQYTGNIDTSIAADAYDLDLFETTEEKIGQLHGKGSRVICYFSAGSYENWRPDKTEFPEAALGMPLDGWKGERWLDIRDTKVREIMKDRLDRARDKGCDAVDPDNVDGYANRTGFNLKASDQLDYNRFLAAEGHARGLAVGLKNDVEQIGQLAGEFDFTVNEQCFQYRECGAVTTFIDQGKPVFQLEYAKAGRKAKKKAQTICPKANNLGFQTQIKQLNLGAGRIDCQSWAN